MLTFELNEDGSQLDLHADVDGARELITELQRLVDHGKTDHVHLMSPEWGGAELSAAKQDAAARLLHKVTIHLWVGAG